MRWRIPLVVVLALFVAVSCDQQPVEPQVNEVAEVPSILTSADGNNGAVRWIPDPECGVIDGDGEFFILEFDAPVEAILDAHGHVPLPPYIERPDEAADRERYEVDPSFHIGISLVPARQSRGRFDRSRRGRVVVVVASAASLPPSPVEAVVVVVASSPPESSPPQAPATSASAMRTVTK